MTSRWPCYCSQTIKFPTLGKWFLFFLKSFFYSNVNPFAWGNHLTFFRSPHDFPTFLLLILCLWRYEWTFCTSRNAKIRKITNTCIIQDSYKFFMFNWRLLPNFPWTIIFFTHTQKGLRSFRSMARLLQVSSLQPKVRSFHTGSGWKNEEKSLSIGANWLGAAWSDPTMERSDRIPTNNKHIHSPWVSEDENWQKWNKLWFLQ